MFAEGEVVLEDGLEFDDTSERVGFLGGGVAKGVGLEREDQGRRLLLNPWREFCGCLLFGFLHHFSDGNGDTVLVA